MCPIANGFQDTFISSYSSKTVDKKDILRSVSNTGIYCSSDKGGIVKGKGKDIPVQAMETHRVVRD
jgi:hypothetical protein